MKFRFTVKVTVSESQVRLYNLSRRWSCCVLTLLKKYVLEGSVRIILHGINSIIQKGSIVSKVILNELFYPSTWSRFVIPTQSWSGSVSSEDLCKDVRFSSCLNPKSDNSTPIESLFIHLFLIIVVIIIIESYYWPDHWVSVKRLISYTTKTALFEFELR